MKIKKLIIICVICIVFTSLFACQFKASGSRVPSNEEVKTAFIKANSLYKMFYGIGLDVDKNDEYKTEDDHLYYAVNYEGIKSLNDLKIYLSNIFSSQIVDELINIGFVYSPLRFIEMNGKLYQESYDYSVIIPNYKIIEKEIIIEKESDVKFKCSMDKILNDDESKSNGVTYKFDYVYEKVGDRWIFTEFPLFKPFTNQDNDYSMIENNYPKITEIKDTSEVKQAWEKAMSADGWFKLRNFVETKNSFRIITKDYDSYIRVYNDDFRTLKDLENYLLTLFSEKIVENYISSNRFISIDGQLYYAEWEKGSWFVKTKGENVEKINDGKYVYTWSFVDGFPEDTDDGKEVYKVDYIYEYVEGHWVFTDFPNYSQVK